MILPRILPRVLPEMGPAAGTAVKVVVDLFTESEAEAAEELMQVLVSGTIAEIKQHVSQAHDPTAARRSAERSIARFKDKARQRAHRWGADHDDRRRRYRRHLVELQEQVEQAKDHHEDWQRNIFDDVGEIIEEAL